MTAQVSERRRGQPAVEVIVPLERLGSAATSRAVRPASRLPGAVNGLTRARRDQTGPEPAPIGSRA
jgi:hypothetical protein